MSIAAETFFEQVVLVDVPGPAERDPGGVLTSIADTVVRCDVADVGEVLGREAAPLLFISSRVPRDAALSLLHTIPSVSAAVRTVVLCEKPEADWTIRCLGAGAMECLPGLPDADSLRRLARGIARHLEDRADETSRYFSDACPEGVELAGRSPAMAKAFEMLRIVAESRCNPILILGQTGTGKELAAQAVHAWRCGPGKRFVAVNCAALTSNLLESELFGHVKGAFTGADRDKTGLFEAAGDGCLFLDEISEMPLELQAKMLRVLQEKNFRKVGGTVDIPYKATVIASSNRNLFAESRAGRFRSDLYYRLGVFPITMPPLHSPDRRSDIPLLAQYFLHMLTHGRARLTEEAMVCLTNHDWPGNVRELRNVMERATILCKSDRVGAECILIDGQPDPAPAPEPSQTIAVPNRFSLETAEREFICRALTECGGQRSRAATLLGITRATLHAKIKRYGIQTPEVGASA